MALLLTQMAVVLLITVTCGWLALKVGQARVITKHYDGFCVFDSSYTDYKITNTHYGRDVVKQLAEASRLQC